MSNKGRGNTQDRQFMQSIIEHTQDFNLFVKQCINASLSLFIYENLPQTINSEYIERQLICGAPVVFFKDDVIGELCLKMGSVTKFDVYGEPSEYGATGENGYIVNGLNADNSVVMYNNMLHEGNKAEIMFIAQMLYNFDRIIKVNVNAQRTPVLIKTDEKRRLTMLNLYKKWEGDEPFIMGDKTLNDDNFDVLSTNAPFVADKIYQVKKWYKQEMLTLIGIPTYDKSKTERLITDEVTLSATEALSYAISKLNARQCAIDKVNAMWGTNYKVMLNPIYLEVFNKSNKEDNNE